MTTNKSNQKESNSQPVKETADCIYERLRSHVTRTGSAQGPISHIFFVFGASVCLIYSNRLKLSYLYYSRVI